MPIIQDKQAPSQHNIIYWQVGAHDNLDAQWVVRKGSWKLIGNVKEPSGQSKEKDLPRLFLTNLEEDVSEQNNLAETHPKMVQELLKLHEDWLHSVRSEVGK